MKKKVILISVLILLGICSFLSIRKTQNQQSLWLDNVEALSGSEDPRCIAGGPGATSCSLDGSVAGVGVSCSVTCGTGYACCGLTVGCVCF